MARSIRRANAAEALTSDDNKDFLKNHFGRKILLQVFGEFSSLTRGRTYYVHVYMSYVDYFGCLVGWYYYVCV
jgi:hypothetical protein